MTELCKATLTTVKGRTFTCQLPQAHASAVHSDGGIIWVTSDWDAHVESALALVASDPLA